MIIYYYDLDDGKIVRIISGGQSFHGVAVHQVSDSPTFGYEFIDYVPEKIMKKVGTEHYFLSKSDITGTFKTPQEALDSALIQYKEMCDAIDNAIENRTIEDIIKTRQESEYWYNKMKEEDLI